MLNMFVLSADLIYVAEMYETGINVELSITEVDALVLLGSSALLSSSSRMFLVNKKLAVSKKKEI